MRDRFKGFSGFALVMGLLLVFATQSFSMVYPGYPQNQPKPFIIKGLVSVQFEDDIPLNSLKSSYGKAGFGIPSVDLVLDNFEVSEAKKLFPWRTEKPAVNSGMVDLTRFYELRFPESIDVNDVIEALLKDPNIRMAEPVWAYPVDATPNDPQWTDQWAMAPDALNRPDPNFYSAWDFETGSDSIKIALIDSGVKHSHPDLINNVWVNPGEDLDNDGVVFDEEDLNGVDDDGNGVIDDLIGYDFFTGLTGGVWPGEDPNTPDPDPDDFNGHGTHCAGIAAACNNNSTGVTGIAGGWYGGSRSFVGARIMCLRVGATGTDGNGYINMNNAASAIDYAAFNGAHVINASWGSSAILSSAVNNAIAAGINFFHAAGNDNADDPDYLDQIIGNPVLSVASVGPNTDVKSSFSNYGNWVDVSAPGSSILSTYSFDGTAGYATLGGTSMASPMVAGLALLIRSQMPSLSKAQVDSIIMATADYDALYDANPFYLDQLGTGRIDAYQALLNLANAKFTADITMGSAPMGVQFTDLSPNSPTAWDWSFGDGGVSTDQNPFYTYNEPGIYTVSLKEDEGNPLGLGEEHLKNYIYVTADTIKLDSVEGFRGSQIMMPVYLNNTQQVKEVQFAFTFANSIGISYDSCSVEGLRTEYFERATENAVDLFNKKVSISLRTNITTGSTYLPADTGLILKLYFRSSSSGSDGVMTIDTATVSSKSTKMITLYGEFVPKFEVGKIVVTGCAHGDADCSESVDIADLVMLVDYSFNSGPAPDPVGGDVNGDGQINIEDIVYLVEFMFNSGPPPPSK